MNALLALQAVEGGPKERGEDKWVDLIFKLMDSIISLKLFKPDSMFSIISFVKISGS